VRCCRRCPMKFRLLYYFYSYSNICESSLLRIAAAASAAAISCCCSCRRLSSTEGPRCLPAFCLPSPRAQAKPGAGRPSHSAPAHQTRTTALPPSRTDTKASRDTSLSRCQCQRHRLAQRKFRRLTIERSQHGAFLLNCSTRCSFAHPASYFLHSDTLFRSFHFSTPSSRPLPFSLRKCSSRSRTEIRVNQRHERRREPRDYRRVRALYYTP
jgi:hypothetical protein